MEAPPPLSRNPSSFKLNNVSPLASLVRRTSERANKPKSSSPEPRPLRTDYTQEHEQNSDDYDSPAHPPSPLLHTQFRMSTATGTTWNDASSYYDGRSMHSYADSSQDAGYFYPGDDESVYSFQQSRPSSPSGRPSTSSQRPHYGYHEQPREGGRRSPWQTATASPYYGRQSPSSTGGNQVQGDEPVSPNTVVPALVVSDHDPHAERPGRAPMQRLRSEPSPNSLRPPALPSESQKRQVLARNSSRNSSRRVPSAPPSPTYSIPPTPTQSVPSLKSPSSADRPPKSPSYPTGTPPSSRERSASPAHLMPSGHSPSEPPRPQRRPPSPSAQSPYSTSSSRSVSPSPLTHTPPSLPGTPNTPDSVTLPRKPPSLRMTSTSSVYSAYSFYQLDSPRDGSPEGAARSAAPISGSREGDRHLSPNSGNPVKKTPSALSLQSQAPSTGGTTPQEYLQLGIQHHEANRLAESAACFEKSARVNGGCGVGMLMWGLTLRHGWGCEKNEKSGFSWLRKAAELATEELESTKEGASQTELVLAIYEVAQCFFQGWGVPKDQKMAVSYYTVAARLGDADAQQDLAFCLANGKGCKKDRKEAAKWYRAAVKQGASDVGLAWIYKEKFS